MAPALNTDGSQLTDLSGYRVKYGRESTNLSQSESITDSSATSYEVKYLTTGTWYFAMVAINSAGEESDQSGVVSITIT
jgi:hypothetical protein